MITQITQTAHGYEIILDGQTMFVPDAPGNRHWQMVQDAITAGAEVTVETPSEPQTDQKLVGVEFEGVMCSATAADQNGLAAVMLTIQLQGAAFQPTRFHFDNGNTLVITLANWQAFAAVWLPFRQSFFAVTG